MPRGHHGIGVGVIVRRFGGIMINKDGVGFAAVLRVREFRFLWAAELFSVVGDQLARVALALLVFAQTSSASLTALTYALTFVPSVLGGVLLSGLADRFPRRRVLVVTDLVRAGLAGAMAVPGMPLPVLWGLVGVLSMAAAPFKAAQLAILPQVLDREVYRTGLSLRQVTAQAAQLLGFGAGGVLLVVVEAHLALAANAATFVLSAGLVLLGVRARPAAAVAEARAEGSGERASWGAVWPLFALAGLVGLYVVPEGLAAPYAAGLGVPLGAAAVGVLMAADPVGSVFGGWLSARVPWAGSARVVVWLAVAAGAPLVVCAWAPGSGAGLLVSVAAWALSGVFSTIFLVRLQEMVIDRVPDSRRGGVLGRLSSCLYASQGVAILAGGVAADAIGPFRAVAVAGVVAMALAASIGGVWWWARSRHERVAGNEPDMVDCVHHRSLLAIAGTSSPGSDCSPDPEVEVPVDDQGSGGDAHSPLTATLPSSTTLTSATQSTVPGEGMSRGFSAFRRRWRRYRLWRLPRRGRCYVVGVEVAAVVSTVWLASRFPAGRREIVLFAVIVVLGLVCAEATRRVEGMRRRFSDTPHVNMSSVWTLSAALVTTPALATAATAVLYLHMWRRSWRQVSGMYPYRVVFSVAAVALSCHAAFLLEGALPGSLSLTAAHPTGLAILVAVIVVYWMVNSALVGLAISLLRRHRSIGRLVGSWQENSLEFATLSVGALAALLFASSPWAVALVLFPIFVLHRSVLVRQLEHAATTDEKTGLLNAGTWRSLANAELDRARQHGTQLGVLMVDVDYFKGVNDRYGHLVGDRALRAVAEAMCGAMRGGMDLVGRFGGEEFVILLIGTDQATSVEIGERVCERVRALRVEDPISGGCYPDLRLSVSVGVATYPDAGADLDEVLLAADTAVFAAKDAGRDRVLAVQLSGSSAAGSGVARSAV
jgi:diguanylate cyclase (GGDEF)-like protein